MQHPLADFLNMTEDDFRQRVLIPLLAAMAYRQVEHYHGPTELGKDIVAWRETTEGTRENLAVVAKKGKIRATASGDVQTVAIQVRQAYGSSFLDKVTGEEQPVHKVIVAATGKINADSRKAILSAIADTNISRHVQFWGGDTVSELLQKHMPVPTLKEGIELVRHRLSGLKAFKVEPTIQGDRTIFRIEAREEGMAIADLSFKFPNTKEGKEAFENMRRLLEEGQEVTIPGEFIERFEQHAELSELFGTEKPATIQMGPVRGGKLIPVFLVAQREGYEALTYEGLRLQIWRAGSESIELRSDADGEPLQLQLTAYRPVGLKINFQIDASGLPVFRARQALRFWKAVAEGASLELRHAGTNQRVFRADEVPGAEAPAEEFMELLENLMFVQEQVGVPLTLPDGFSRDLLDSAAEVRQVLEEGRAVQPFESFSATLTTRQARFVLKAFPPGEPRMMALTTEDATTTLCGTEIRLGQMVRIADDITVTPEAHAELARSVQAGGEAHPLEVRPLPECVGLRHFFPNYLKGEALDEYNRVYGQAPRHEADWQQFEEA